MLFKKCKNGTSSTIAARYIWFHKSKCKVVLLPKRSDGLAPVRQSSTLVMFEFMLSGSGSFHSTMHAWTPAKGGDFQFFVYLVLEYLAALLISNTSFLEGKSWIPLNAFIATYNALPPVFGKLPTPVVNPPQVTRLPRWNCKDLGLTDPGL